MNGRVLEISQILSLQFLLTVIRSALTRFQHVPGCAANSNASCQPTNGS